MWDKHTQLLLVLVAGLVHFSVTELAKQRLLWCRPLTKEEEEDCLGLANETSPGLRTLPLFKFSYLLWGPAEKASVPDGFGSWRVFIHIITDITRETNLQRWKDISTHTSYTNTHSNYDIEISHTLTYTHSHTVTQSLTPTHRTSEHLAFHRHTTS